MPSSSDGQGISRTGGDAEGSRNNATRRRRRGVTDFDRRARQMEEQRRVREVEDQRRARELADEILDLLIRRQGSPGSSRHQQADVTDVRQIGGQEGVRGLAEALVETMQADRGVHELTNVLASPQFTGQQRRDVTSMLAGVLRNAAIEFRQESERSGQQVFSTEEYRLTDRHRRRMQEASQRLGIEVPDQTAIPDEETEWSGFAARIYGEIVEERNLNEHEGFMLGDILRGGQNHRDINDEDRNSDIYIKLIDAVLEKWQDRNNT